MQTAKVRLSQVEGDSKRYLAQFVGLINPAFLIPKIIKIYFTHTHLVGGVSAIAFAGFTISWFCWIYNDLVFKRWAWFLLLYCQR